MSSLFQRLNIRTVAIWASNEDGLIGVNGQIPWHLPMDLKFYAANTRKSVVIVGRKTFESLPEVALQNRQTIVISSSDRGIEDCNAHWACNFTAAIGKALSLLGQMPELKREIYFAGGSCIYNEAIRLEMVDEIIKTSVSFTAGDELLDDFVYAPVIPNEKFKMINFYEVPRIQAVKPVTFYHYMRREIADRAGVVRPNSSTASFYKALSDAKII